MHSSLQSPAVYVCAKVQATCYVTDRKHDATNSQSCAGFVPFPSSMQLQLHCLGIPVIAAMIGMRKQRSCNCLKPGKGTKPAWEGGCPSVCCEYHFTASSGGCDMIRCLVITARQAHTHSLRSNTTRGMGWGVNGRTGVAGAGISS